MRAKFQVNFIEQNSHSTRVELSPVMAGSEENKQFWKATPTGSLMMSISNPEAKTFFKEGQEYYLDFTPAN